MVLRKKKKKEKTIQRASGIDFGNHIISEMKKRMSYVGIERCFSPIFRHGFTNLRGKETANDYKSPN